MTTQLEMYKAKQGEIVKEYNGQIISVKDGVVLGAYSNRVAALHDMQEKNHQPGSFMIIKCTPGDEEYTAVYRSRVEFKQTGLPISDPCQA